MPKSPRQSERPCALQEAINGAQSACSGERQNEPMAAALQGVANQHRRNSEQAEEAKGVHPANIPQENRSGGDWVVRRSPSSERATSRGSRWRTMTAKVPNKQKAPAVSREGFFGLTCREEIVKRSVLCRPGSDLLFQALRLSTIGAGDFDGRVRDGIGYRLPAVTTR